MCRTFVRTTDIPLLMFSFHLTMSLHSQAPILVSIRFRRTGGVHDCGPTNLERFSWTSHDASFPDTRTSSNLVCAMHRRDGSRVYPLYWVCWYVTNVRTTTRSSQRLVTHNCGSPLLLCDDGNRFIYYGRIFGNCGGGEITLTHKVHTLRTPSIHANRGTNIIQ